MEFYENMRFMKSLPLEPVGDVLVIAVDVGYLFISSNIKTLPTGRITVDR